MPFFKLLSEKICNSWQKKKIPLEQCYQVLGTRKNSSIGSQPMRPNKIIQYFDSSICNIRPWEISAKGIHTGFFKIKQFPKSEYLFTKTI